MDHLFSTFRMPESMKLFSGKAFSLKVGEDVCPGPSFKRTVQQDRKLVYSNGKVEVTAQFCIDAVHNVIEYNVSVKNISEEYQRVFDVRSLDIHVLNDDKDVYIHSFFGGDIELYYPPDNFSEKIVTMSPAQSHPEESWCPGYRINSQNGRSTDHDFPIAFIENKEKTCGYFMGVVWSGDWFMEFAKPIDGRLHIFGGMRFIDMLIDPGETIELPQIILGAYEGDSDVGTNAIRRYITDTRLKKLSKEQLLPPVSFDHWFSLGINISEEKLKKQADKLDGLGIEYFVTDAGWYKNVGKYRMDFHYGTGNYTIVDNEKFPNGLEPLYKYLKKKGLKGGLWFEPERAGEGTDAATKLPQAMLRSKNAGDHFYRTDLCFVDFGNKEAVEYTKAYLKHYFETLDLKWIRWDFNLQPRHYWKEKDRPGRRGETELAHIKGLYSILQWINDEYPQVVIEGCASGGQRMDLGAMKYSSTFWCNDQCYNAHTSRYLLTTGNKIMPGNYLNRAVTPRLGEGKDIPDYYFMSHFGGAFAINDPVQYWTETTRERCRKHVAVYKQLRKYLYEDYYQLLPQPRSIEDDEAWEFIDPILQEGFVQVFRTEGKNDTLFIKMKGLTEDEYTFTDPYTGESARYTCEQLTNGLVFELEKMSSKVRLFKKA